MRSFPVFVLMLLSIVAVAEPLPEQPVFALQQAVGSELDLDPLTGDATLKVFYTGMGKGDTVGARLAGVLTRDTVIQTVTAPGVLSFNLPRSWLRENLGRTVTLTYSYKAKGTGKLFTSAALPVSIVSTRPEQFGVAGTVDGQLEFDSLGDDAKVTVLFGAMAPGDTVGVRLVGSVTRDTKIEKVVDDGPLTFSIPRAWLQENIGRSITLTYSYKIAGAGALVVSRPLSVTVTSALARVAVSGAQVVQGLNARFQETGPCPGDQADYQCNGVFIRVVDYSPAFRAWNPSPGAQKLGGVSFSYIRRDLKTLKLQENRTHGLILTEGNRWVAPLLPLKVLCAYPYDGGTATRDGSGCGKNKGYADSDRCALGKINTVTQWRRRFTQYPTGEARYDHQCSFDPDKAGFDLSLQARENPDQEHVRWRQNEVVIKTWAQNVHNLPVEAFFYTSTAGREPARSIQKDFYKSTGRFVPVVQVALSAPEVFTYKVCDQVVPSVMPSCK
ncbi:hypothetical protein [Pseudomonas entomophila]|uniref:Uncharacterized protein n=2 Tax=Pseudomonas entomophila TaxID=312306 RepID=Q1I4K9_PSEE4|nr:hypothetical protein [Pseudomonas entomophila]WMW06866.1 hypothetical protein RAH46_05870 [Pseudomonas entomophila]CAK17427.1 conserved hypothetical protein [Pseudomonas entomophila L48]